MKFFGWMQSKFNGVHNKDSKTATSAAHHKKELEPQKQEFSDWPHGLLAIGTFGDLPTENDQNNNNNNNNTSSSPDLSEFTPEEIGKLQKELKNLLSKKPPAANNKKLVGELTSTTAAAHDLPLDRFLNCPSSLEVDRRLSTTGTEVVDKDEDIDRTIKVILGRCKDIMICSTENSTKKAIGKKSTTGVSFLLKKMFVCSSGFPHMNMPPTLQDHPLPESRMERLLRAMLKNKLNPQNCRASSAKKLIDQSPKIKEKAIESSEEELDDANDVGSKWVKTDSEYIVLEI